jgi:hypothetical protein
MNSEIRELSIDETTIIAGGEKSTGSADLDKAIDRAKILVAQFAAQIGNALNGAK